MERNRWMAAVIALGMMESVSSAAEGKTPRPKVFETAHIQDVYRVLLDRDALLLESIGEVIQQKNIQDGYVTVTAGSVQECTYHYVTSTALKPVNAYKTVKGPFEILTAGGIIAAGEAHVHITLSSSDQAAFGGHLEKGCRILYLAELTLFKYAGPPLTRKNNANGVSMLEPK